MFCWEMILKCHAFDAAENQNAESQPGDQMALGGGCVVFIQSRGCSQLAAVHLAQGGVCTGANAAVGVAFPSQSHPSVFSLPLHLSTLIWEPCVGIL